MIEKIVKMISNLKILSKMNEIIDGLNTHTANKNNPHNVTAEQLGLATAYVYKGSVTNFSDLPTNAQNGWVYSVENEHTDSAGILHPAGANFAWNGSKWDDLGGSLSGYAKSVNSQSPDNKGNVNLTLVESLEKNTEDKLVVHNSDGSIQELEVGKKYTINNKLPDANDNYAIDEFEGYWESNESVSVGDVRFLKGKNNTKYLLECVQSGVTGTEQPTISEDTILSDYSDNTAKWGVRRLTKGLAELENIVPISKGGTGANTASQACANLGALPTKGGKITGAIRTYGTGLANIDSSHSTNISGGTEIDDGAYLALRGKNQQETNGVYIGGQFELAAKNNVNYKKLIGNPNGNLTWDSVNIVTPVGMIIPFAGNNIPNNFLVCDGSAVNRGAYDKLFKVIGTKYGTGDGSTTFNLPDLAFPIIQGRIPVVNNSTGQGTYILSIPNFNYTACRTLVAPNAADAVKWFGPPVGASEKTALYADLSKIPISTNIKYIIKYQ